MWTQVLLPAVTMVRTLQNVVDDVQERQRFADHFVVNDALDHVLPLPDRSGPVVPAVAVLEHGARASCHRVARVHDLLQPLQQTIVVLQGPWCVPRGA